MIKKIFAYIGMFLGRMLVMAVCGIASTYLVMSGYESIYNRTLPFIHTLDKVNLSAFTSEYNFDKAFTQSASLYGNFSKPVTLKLPSGSLRLDIVSPIREGNWWLARANTLHLLIPLPPRAGNIGLAFLYCRSSFRTINTRNLPAEGQNIFMDTDGKWRYVYRVTSAKVFSEDQAYVSSDDSSHGKLIIDCNDIGQHTNDIIEADLLSVQGAEQ